MLIGQALHESALLLTADKTREQYGEAVHIIR